MTTFADARQPAPVEPTRQERVDRAVQASIRRERA
jgi:hypothetical protein